MNIMKSRAERLKQTIRELGCIVRMDSYMRQIWVRHKDLQETAFINYIPRDRESIEAGLEEALKIAENFQVYCRLNELAVEDSRQTNLWSGGEA